jgi:flagellar basal-body rod modification protein FlgD
MGGMLGLQSILGTAAQQPTTESAGSPASSSSSSSSTTGSTTVTASDFLQLLVAEMKNQDPTANTDPNEYINQLVQVNSLEQLVQINQDLGGTSGSSTSGETANAISAVNANQPSTAPASGNLSLPAPGSTSGAATRVASVLGIDKSQANPSTSNATQSNSFDAIVAAMRRGAPAAGTITLSPAR